MSKQKILFIGGSYPVSGPNGRITMQYINLLKSNYEIYLICYQLNLTNYYEKPTEGITIFTLYNWRLHGLAFFKNKLNKSSSFFANHLYKLITLFLRGIGRVQAFLFWPDNLRWFYLKSLNKAFGLHSKINFDFIITVCNPLTAHLAGLKFKQTNSDVKWITITFDPINPASLYRRSYIFPALKRRWNSTVEKKIFDKSDFILITKEIENTDNVLFNRYKTKCSILNYLIEEKKSTSVSLFCDENINLVFAGTLYKSIRNPDYLLRTILNIKSSKIRLHLFVTSGCENIIRGLAQRSNGVIIIHTPVDAEEIVSIYRNASVLVNIGNSVSSFKPSKIFEYISTGKPIINFYRNGIIETTLLKYPLALQIDCDKTSVEDASILVERFCVDNKRAEIPWLDIRNLLPDHTEESIKNVLLRSIEIVTMN